MASFHHLDRSTDSHQLGALPASDEVVRGFHAPTRFSEGKGRAGHLVVHFLRQPAHQPFRNVAADGAEPDLLGHQLSLQVSHVLTPLHPRHTHTHTHVLIHGQEVCQTLLQ